jgi:hypothetical protein
MFNTPHGMDGSLIGASSWWVALTMQACSRLRGALLRTPGGLACRLLESEGKWKKRRVGGVFHGPGGASILAYLAGWLQVAFTVFLDRPQRAGGVTVPRLQSIVACIDYASFYYASLESPVEAMQYSTV